MLSPFLFSIFINNLSVELSKGSRGVQLCSDLTELLCLLSADDVALISESIIGLQRQLDGFNVYCDK